MGSGSSEIRKKRNRSPHLLLLMLLLRRVRLLMQRRGASTDGELEKHFEKEVEILPSMFANAYPYEVEEDVGLNFLSAPWERENCELIP